MAWFLIGKTHGLWAWLFTREKSGRRPVVVREDCGTVKTVNPMEKREHTMLRRAGRLWTVDSGHLMDSKGSSKRESFCEENFL